MRITNSMDQRIAWLAALLLVACVGGEARTQKLFLFEREGKWGYADERGAVQIPARFLHALDFSGGGIAAVIDEQGWAYIDRSGRVIVRPYIFDNGPDYFRGGLARIVGRGGKIGFMDKRGRVVIEPRFDYADAFRGGLAAICAGCRSEKLDEEHQTVAGGLWGYVNRRGQTIIPLKYQRAEAFERGKARVWLGGKCQYINERGTVISFKSPRRRNAIKPRVTRRLTTACTRPDSGSPLTNAR